YGAHCLQAILSHPALEEIEFWPDLADLAEVPATGQPHSLKVLKLRLYRTDRQPQVEQEFAWLKDCCELRRIEYRATEPSSFLLKTSELCPTVTELAIENLSAAEVDVLVNWRGLKLVELRGKADEKLLARLAATDLNIMRVRSK